MDRPTTVATRRRLESIRSAVMLSSVSQPSIRKPNPQLSDSVFKMFDMHGKVVIVTGGSGGIGYEVAKGLAEAGAAVALFYKTATNADELAAHLEKTYNVKSKAYSCAVQSFNMVQLTVGQVVSDFGHLDVMIANAGVPSKGGGLDDTITGWQEVVDVDLSGAYYCARAAGHIFKQQGFGNVIFTASMSGHIVNLPQQQACYNACKAGVIHLAKSLAIEWIDFCRVNSISPGYIDTPISNQIPASMKESWYSLIPMRRDADPRELKAAYLYLASDASTYVTGTDLIVDGGYCAR